MSERTAAREASRILLWLLLALILSFAVFGAVMAFAMGTWGYGTMGGMMGWGMGWWGVVMVVPALVLILILLAVLGTFDRVPPGPPSRAKEALDLRLARGEISVEEYERLREKIGP